MSFYELIINVHGEETYETISVGGMHALAAASKYLDNLAKAGEIPGVAEVNVYDTVCISSAQLTNLLEFLRLDVSVAESGTSFDVYLSEV